MHKSDLGNILIILLFGAIIYLNAVPAPFHLDDFPHLVENSYIKNLSDPGAIWSHWPSRFFGFFTFALNYAIGRLRPEGYRAVNIAVHVIGAVWAYLLVALLAGMSGYGERRSRRIAVWTALVFVCHPVQTQAVTYIVQRFASLAGSLTLGALYCYLRGRLAIDSGAPFRSFRHLKFYSSGLLLTILAMTSKESAITIPILILSLELFWPRRGIPIGRRVLYYLPYALTLLVVPALSLYMAVGHGTNPFYYRTNLSAAGRIYVVAQDVFLESRVQYLLTQFNALLVYLRLCILPVRQSIYYDLPISRSLFFPGTYLSLFIVAGLLITAARLVRRQPLAALAIFWFFINLLPTSSVAMLWPFLSEHHLYFPLFSWALLVGLFLSRLGEGNWRRLAEILGWLLVFCLALLTIRRNFIWGDTYRLWEDALRTSPGSPAIYNAMAGAMVKDGRFLEAAETARRAMEINPRLNAYPNLWAAYFNLEELAEAEITARRHGELFPADLRAGINLGMTLLKQEDPAEAREVLAEAVGRQPGSAAARYWLGVSFYELGKDASAIEQLTEVLALNPDYPGAYDYLGRLYARGGQGKKALEIYIRGARINPDSLVLNYNLGMLAWREGETELAEARLLHSLDLAGDERMRKMIASALAELRSSTGP